MSGDAVPDSVPSRLPLAAWMTARGIGDAELARSLGVHRSTISRVRRRLQEPEPELAQRLAEISAGAIDLAAPPGPARGAGLPPWPLYDQLELMRAVLGFIRDQVDFGPEEVDFDRLVAAARAIVRIVAEL